jgi:hypothetical protein
MREMLGTLQQPDEAEGTSIGNQKIRGMDLAKWLEQCVGDSKVAVWAQAVS